MSRTASDDPSPSLLAHLPAFFRPSNRTLAPLLYPPHFIALASIYLASLLGSLGDEDSAASLDAVDPIGTERQGCVALVEVLGSAGGWEERFKSKVGDLEGQSFPFELLSALTCQ